MQVVGASLVVLVVLMAGCSSLEPLPAPVLPLGPATGWVAWGGPLFALETTCGLCAGPAATHAEFTWTGVDTGGRILVVAWGQSEGEGVDFLEPSQRRWGPVVAPLFAGAGLRGQGDGGVRVFDVAGWALSERDWLRVAGVLGAAAERLDGLPEPDYSDCVDCGASVAWAGGQRQEVYRNAPEGSGWPLVQTQMAFLQSWADKPS